VVFSGYSGFLHHDITEISLKVALNTITPNYIIGMAELTTVLVIGTDYTGRCKPNYHTITTTP
jgi:hypothetical protein